MLGRRSKMVGLFLSLLVLVAGALCLAKIWESNAPQERVDGCLNSVEVVLTAEAQKHNAVLQAEKLDSKGLEKFGFTQGDLRNADAFEARIFSAKLSSGKEVFRVAVFVWLTDELSSFGHPTFHFEAKVFEPSIWEFKRAFSDGKDHSVTKTFTARLRRDLRLNEMK